MNRPTVVLRLHPKDDVGVACRALSADQRICVDSLDVNCGAAIPAGHKIALRGLAQGQPVHKYGQVIGFALRDIAAGEHVHTHNLAVRDFVRDYQRHPTAPPTPPAAAGRTFMGYARPDGRVGTRNYLAVISTVNCSASAAQLVRDRFRTPQFRRDFPQVDGVLAFTHKSGCCIQPGQPLEVFQRTLAGMARHPNIFGYIMLGLGCEGSPVASVRDGYGLSVLRPGEAEPAFMEIQDLGGVSRTAEAAVSAMLRLLSLANQARRTPQPASKLMLAMNCGGSDGNSGITANPALGVASDALVAMGGTSVLAETPEIYGAEHLLAARAVSPQVAQDLMERVRWWEEHVRLHGASIDNNPTPGNKAGGLTTIYEKSLGAVAKAGQAPLAAVYQYAQRITAAGLCFMDTPGFDPVSMTGLVAGGCNIGCFTTGRGSVYGCKPSPCIKIASNSALYEHMLDDMDINAGGIMDGTHTIQQVGQQILELILTVAGGQPTKSEAQGIGDEEFAPWPLGPTL